jgi:arylsulfatase A-like enzyme
MSRIIALLIAGMVAGCASRGTPGAAGSRGEKTRPNILLIVADDLGYGDIGVNGGKDIPTPNIDALAAAGVRCTDGYVSGPYCSPTRAGLLTGRYQQRFGHEFNPGGARDEQQRQRIGLPLTETTLAQRLAAVGYDTALIGKWHLGDAEPMRPLNRGFGHFVGFLGGAHPYVRPPRGDVAPVYDDKNQLEDYPYLTDLFAQRGADFVSEDRDRPFFLYLAFNAVHTPMQPTDAKLRQFAHIKDERRRQYAAMLSSMDDAIGRVLDALSDRRLERDTLVFFISDNGGPERGNASDNGPLRGGKATTWEGGIRVPFILRWPGRLPDGAVYRHPVIQLDIVPTCLAAAGVEVKSGDRFDGVNLVPAILNRSMRPPHETLFWRFGPQMAIRRGDWKLVIARGDEEPLRRGDLPPADLAGAKLFNLATDPGEQRDVAGENPQVAAELTAAWQRWNAELQPPRWPQPERPRQQSQPQRPRRRDR